jgi:glycyl-tRNA synthetase beta chain
MIQDLLIEIGTEELPPTSLRDLATAFGNNIENQLDEIGIGHGKGTIFCTPRRLAVLIHQVHSRQKEREVVRRGPSVNTAFTSDGYPTKALEGFARSCGVEIKELVSDQSDKGAWIIFKTIVAGQTTEHLIPQIIEKALMGLPIAKRMRWGAGEELFVRPVHWICIVFGDHTIQGNVLGLNIDRRTYGHRFHAPDPLDVSSASAYPQLLRQHGYVEPHFDTRRELILTQMHKLANDHGVRVELSETLLDEVTSLVEWPIAIYGSFDKDFLSVPAEVLIETMQKNQKYFPIRDLNGRLQAHFIAISNIESKRPEEVIKGNERVLRPRFSDAKFFWNQDLRHPLIEFFDKLEFIVFQDKLGSVADRSRRVAKLSKYIATSIGESPDIVERAALLAKCDLATSMVYEFPNLQGVMGRYYADKSSEPPAVCDAIEEHYLPRFSGDALPVTGCGMVLALADRLDLLLGTFGIGHRPTGAKDPYGLRRASIAIIRLLVESKLELNLYTLLQAGALGFKTGIISNDTPDAVINYIFGRLEGYYQDQGISQDCVESVMAIGGHVLSQIDRKIHAVHSFKKLPEGLSLAAANKRISNILSKSGNEGDFSATPKIELFSEDAEHRLWDKVRELEHATEPLIRQQSFSTILLRLAELENEVNLFFENVMVNVEEKDIRENRLRILTRLRAIFLHVADISLLH